MALALAAGAYAQSPAVPDSATMARAWQAESDRREAIAATFKYDSGSVPLGRLATLTLPAGYRYLAPDYVDQVMGTWGGTPGGATLGMIVPRGVTVGQENCWWILIRYDALGWVDDTKGLPSPEDLMWSLRSIEERRNQERMAAENHTLEIHPWLVEPSYDPALKVLRHAVVIRDTWKNGENIRFDPFMVEYQVRFLGREGVLRLDVFTYAGFKAAVKAGMEPLLAAVAFSPGFRHSDFDAQNDIPAVVSLRNLIVDRPYHPPIVEPAVEPAKGFGGWRRALIILLVPVLLLARRFVGKRAAGKVADGAAGRTAPREGPDASPDPRAGPG